MGCRVILIGTIHYRGIKDYLVDYGSFKNVLKKVQVIIVESPVHNFSLKSITKAPGIYLGEKVRNTMISLFQFITKLHSNEGFSERSSLRVICKEIGLTLQYVEIEEVPRASKSDEAKVNAVKCRDFSFDEAISSMGPLSVILNYLLLLISIIFFIGGLYDILNGDYNSIWAGFILLLISILPTNWLWARLVKKWDHRRNKVALEYCKRLISHGYNRILLVYGNSHMRELKELFISENIELEIIQTKIPSSK